MYKILFLFLLLGNTLDLIFDVPNYYKCAVDYKLERMLTKIKLIIRKILASQ